MSVRKILPVRTSAPRRPGAWGDKVVCAPVKQHRPATAKRVDRGRVIGG